MYIPYQMTGSSMSNKRINLNICAVRTSKTYGFFGRLWPRWHARRISFYPQLILLLVFSASINGAESVPSPTKLERAWNLPNSKMKSELKLGEVSTSTTRMTISQVSVETVGGETLSGIKIYLNSSIGACIFSGCSESGDTDLVFLDSEFVPQILAELKEVESRNLSGYFGIARCRPSQPVPQAYCLESFVINETDFGILVRTPKAWFKFTEVLPRDVGEIISRYSSKGGT